MSPLFRRHARGKPEEIFRNFIRYPLPYIIEEANDKSTSIFNLSKWKYLANSIFLVRKDSFISFIFQEISYGKKSNYFVDCTYLKDQKSYCINHRSLLFIYLKKWAYRAFALFISNNKILKYSRLISLLYFFLLVYVHANLSTSHYARYICRWSNVQIARERGERIDYDAYEI